MVSHALLESIHWQGRVTMVNKVLVAMETLFWSNQLVHLFEFWIAVPPHQSTWFVCITCCFSHVLIFFLFCIFILIRCTVCGCMYFFRLLVPFKIVSLSLSNTDKQHTRDGFVFSHSGTHKTHSNRNAKMWQLTYGRTENRVGRAGRWTNMAWTGPIYWCSCEWLLLLSRPLLRAPLSLL